jgi:hypothetical protein
MARTSYVCTRLARLISARSLKQPSSGRHIAILGHIIAIPSQTAFALTHARGVRLREVTNTNFTVFGLTLPGLGPYNLPHPRQAR